MMEEWRAEHWERMDCWMSGEGMLLLSSSSLLSLLLLLLSFLSALLFGDSLDQFHVDEYLKDMTNGLGPLWPLWPL